ncbi:hypothetical protein [Pseudodesulfovibrio piezophilus]|uniref:Uncharacterized protein n=1 Tax=Pseudodesulfovibrio piezophilus (strain DSM 21447 / JCM 15486 / C1TLV30) TaxID=1322246 RepID=M1WVM8_PSEP2|nr:hypothetical protein [Pseudodesulfovibrio piezophilus]CCH48608.1 conserved protein of unknown function [Pseudodesulfovibrio piezophilus C1TLV30]
MILDANQIAAIRQRNDEEVRRGKRGTHGYPAQTVQNLLHTIEALKKEKRKWKKLAQTRGKALGTISELAKDSNGQ